MSTSLSTVSSEEAIIKDPGKLWSGGQSPLGVSWGKLYMWIFLLSDVFTFSGLLIAYGTLRHNWSEIWPKQIGRAHV